MSQFNLLDYAPIGLMFLIAAGFATSQLLATQLFGPRKRTKIKLMPYECGKDPVGSARDRFSVKFYTVAVDFLLFDIEVLFLVPFAVAFTTLISAGLWAYGVPAFVAMLVFMAMVIVGFAYAWLKGTFDWSVQARSEARAEAFQMLKEKRKLNLPAGVEVVATVPKVVVKQPVS